MSQCPKCAHKLIFVTQHDYTSTVVQGGHSASGQSSVCCIVALEETVHSLVESCPAEDQTKISESRRHVQQQLMMAELMRPLVLQQPNEEEPRNDLLTTPRCLWMLLYYWLLQDKNSTLL